MRNWLPLEEFLLQLTTYTVIGPKISDKPAKSVLTTGFRLQNNFNDKILNSAVLNNHGECKHCVFWQMVQKV